MKPRLISLLVMALLLQMAAGMLSQTEFLPYEPVCVNMTGNLTVVRPDNLSVEIIGCFDDTRLLGNYTLIDSGIAVASFKVADPISKVFNSSYQNGTLNLSYNITYRLYYNDSITYMPMANVTTNSVEFLVVDEANHTANISANTSEWLFHASMSAAQGNYSVIIISNLSGEIETAVFNVSLLTENLTLNISENISLNTTLIITENHTNITQNATENISNELINEIMQNLTLSCDNDTLFIRYALKAEQQSANSSLFISVIYPDNSTIIMQPALEGAGHNSSLNCTMPGQYNARARVFLDAEYILEASLFVHHLDALEQYLPLQPVIFNSSWDSLIVVDPNGLEWLVIRDSRGLVFEGTQVLGNYRAYNGSSWLTFFVEPDYHASMQLTQDGAETIIRVAFLRTVYDKYAMSATNTTIAGAAVLVNISDSRGSERLLGLAYAGEIYEGAVRLETGVYTVTAMVSDGIFSQALSRTINVTLPEMFLSVEKETYIPFEPVVFNTTFDTLYVRDPNGELEMISRLDTGLFYTKTNVLGEYIAGSLYQNITANWTVESFLSAEQDISVDDGEASINLNVTRALFDGQVRNETVLDAEIMTLITDSYGNIMTLEPTFEEGVYVSEIFLQSGEYDVISRVSDSLNEISISEKIIVKESIFEGYLPGASAIGRTGRLKALIEETESGNRIHLSGRAENLMAEFELINGTNIKRRLQSIQDLSINSSLLPARRVTISADTEDGEVLAGFDVKPTLRGISAGMTGLRRLSGEPLAGKGFVPGIYSGRIENETVWVAVGLVTINSKKPLYHPGEMAQFVSVLLDSEGYCVQSGNLTVELTEPDGSMKYYSTDSGGILQDGPCTYVFSHLLSQEGKYSISAVSIMDNIRARIETYVNTAASYPFDIIRDVPYTIDPWQGPFNNEFSVVPLLPDVEPISITEYISGEFTVTTGGFLGGNLTVFNITWLLPSNASYIAQAPLKTPYMYELGQAYLVFRNTSSGEIGVFVENRSWMLALDPLVAGNKACYSVYSSGYDAGDDTATCAQVNLSDNLRPAGGDNALQSYDFNEVDVYATLEVTFDSLTPDYNITSAALYIEWGVEDTGGSCTIQAFNGSYTTLDTTCYGTPETLRYYNLSSIVRRGSDLNGFRARISYLAFRDGGDRTDRLYVDRVYILYNISMPPGYDTWGLNVSDGGIVRRGELVRAYARWNYTSGILGSYIAHDGSGGYQNYSVPAPYTGNWTNVTLNTSNTTQFSFAGRVNVESIYAMDIDVYNKTGPAKYFFVYDYSNISSSALNSSQINESGSATVSCLILDESLGIPISNYNVLFYRNGNYVSSAKTNSTGWANYTASYTTPGTYNLTCVIGDAGYYYASQYNRSTSLLTVLDSSPPSVTLASPENNSQDTDGNVTFRYNVSDAWSDIANCTLMLNGSANKTETAISESSTNEINVLLAPGAYIWTVNCTDVSANANFAASLPRMLSVSPDLNPPLIEHQQPPHGADTDVNVTLMYNVTDVLTGISNCTLILDGVRNATNTSIPNGGWINVPLYSLDPGIHTWRVNCSDNSTARNWNISTTWIFNVGDDLTPPVITMVSPSNNSIDTDGKIDVTYNVTDFMSGVMNCSLYLNGTLNQTNSSIIEGALQVFSLDSVAESFYHLHVNCTDDSINRNEGKGQTVYLTVDYDLADPVISLISPSDNYVSTTGVVDFTYTVSDESSIANCSLYVNGTLNRTNYMVTKNANMSFQLTGMADGNYTWTVGCVDGSDTHNSSQATPWNLAVGPDVTAPSITLYAPSNQSLDTDGQIVFIYSVADATSGIGECTAYVNGSAVDTDSAITEGSIQSLATALADGWYVWYINCTDDSPQSNKGMSEWRYLNVSVMYQTNFTLTAEYQQLAQGEFLNATGILKDQGGVDIQGGNVSSYIIRNLGADNQTLPWLNSSWQRRVELPVTNTLSSVLEAIPLNFTIDTQSLIAAGLMRSDCLDMRFGDQSNNLLPHYLFDANMSCNSATTKVIVLAERLWGSGTHRIGLYFNYSAAQNASNRNAAPIVDNFDDGDTSSYWITDYTSAADIFARSSTDSYDGTYSARSSITCGAQCAAAGGRTSSISKSIEVNANSTLFWYWKRANNGGNLRFYLDNVLTTTCPSNGNWNNGSAVVGVGTHTLKWEFEVTTQNTYAAYLDQVYLVTQGITYGAATSQSQFAATINKTTTSSDGTANLLWDSTGYPYGNYSITGYATKGSYWEDNGSYDFRLGEDTRSPWYTVWALNVSEGANMTRYDTVLAYSLWHDKVNVSVASALHNGTGYSVNYPISLVDGKTAWANFTMNLSNSSQFSRLGNVSISISANDTAGNRNATSNRSVFIFSYSNVSESAVNDTQVLIYDNFTMSCLVRDQFNGSTIPDYPVAFYVNGSYMATGLTDAGGWANQTLSATITGTIESRCQIASQPSLFYIAALNDSGFRLINVTDDQGPNVSLYRPENNSEKTTPTLAMGFLVDDTGPISTCTLYGDWGGWHAVETIYNPEKGWPNVNYFTPITFTSGTYQWFVACNDTFDNMGQSGVGTFNISMSAPVVSATFPANGVLAAPGPYTFNYTVSQPADDVAIMNCSLSIDGVWNQTTYGPIAKAVPQNFSVDYLGWGAHNWTVECQANNTLSGSVLSYLYIYSLEAISPANGTSVDRDGVLPEPDSIILTVKEISGASGLGVRFRANVTEPDLTKNLSLGSVVTNATGHAELIFNPDISYFAGNYTWWAEFLSWPNASNNSLDFQIYGAVDIFFNHTAFNPNSGYDFGSNMSVDANIVSLGNETALMIASEYGYALDIVMIPPSGLNVVKRLGYNQSIWATTINTTLLPAHGDWNASLNGTNKYLFVNSTEWRLVFINITVDAAVLEVRVPACMPYYMAEIYANISNLGTENITNITVDLLVNGIINSTTAINLSEHDSLGLTFPWKAPEGLYNITVQITLPPMYNDSAVNNQITQQVIRDNQDTVYNVSIANLADDLYRVEAIAYNMMCNLSTSSLALVPQGFSGTAFTPIADSNITHASGSSYIWMRNITSWPLNIFTMDVIGGGRRADMYTGAVG
jgi:hypothetical protein